ncbi:hypothetical protein A0H81_11291 [Grifola frondosa]|uniref:Uncharacterized protein n=1 Tax=Grifola frondosa TaxID=5627 RepID=A0A1C7LWD8_GRIFR|nr:hypothetical protein A0H81_11291 [Grifola frondosa]
MVDAQTRWPPINFGESGSSAWLIFSFSSPLLQVADRTAPTMPAASDRAGAHVSLFRGFVRFDDLQELAFRNVEDNIPLSTADRDRQVVRQPVFKFLERLDGFVGLEPSASMSPICDKTTPNCGRRPDIDHSEYLHLRMDLGAETNCAGF